MSAPRADRPSSGRRWALRLGLPLSAVALVGAVIYLGGRDAAQAESAQGEPVALSSTQVQRRDLVEVESLSGTLGYGDSRAVSGALAGTVTWVAGAGSVRTRNQILHMVDESPVLLMYGVTPAYRDMASGQQGRDVLQLERNLSALGFDADGDMAVDGAFDGYTAEAVRQWQESWSLDQTGVVERGRVVFLPGARRVAVVSAKVGGAATGAIMTTTSSARTVAVDLDARRQDLVELGAAATVELADGSEARATVTSIGRVATAVDAESTPTVSIEFTVAAGDATGLPDSSPVSVEVEADRARDVLAVPVNAVLALAGGGYGLERVNDDGSRTVVMATLGASADGQVQVEGPNVVEGMRVVVPQ